ncbi:hypothetical protein [Sphingomonas hankyongi]|uniref:Uncharacterized protein n=1 Tax=Sphingomonas hankyongi TaxID=2908209 RepID=A0ABT0S3B2_9SPHN|nr:hypothetical protein [Sphingomonas hankyongi]MCL6730321.1 hypothetical protein [Sphingomonas hankyongi]
MPDPVELQQFRVETARLLISLKSDLRALEYAGCEPTLVAELKATVTDVEGSLAGVVFER